MANTPQSSEGNSSSSAVMDSSSPYYLHPSDSPGMNLVNFVFDGTIFAAWRRSIIISLSAKNKMSFIDGSSEIPSADTPEFKLWTRCNNMVISWLLNSLSKEIAGSVIYSKSAKDLWTDLHDRFGQSNGAQLYHLKKSLTDLVQGTTDVSGYFTRIKRIRDELDALSSGEICSCNCTCGGKKKIVKSKQDERLIQFLMGLNDVYAAVRNNILMMSPLPNVNHAYSILIQDEKQREAYVNPKFPGDSSSFLATHQNFSGQRIIGYPPDFKFSKGSKSQPNNKGNSMANAVTTVGYSGYTTNGKQENGSVAQENYGRLEEEFQNAQIGDVPFAGSEVSANMVHCFADSGASAHMSFDPSFFTTLTLLPSPIYVKLPNSFRGHSMRTPLVIGEAKDGIYIVTSGIFAYSKNSKQFGFCSSFPSAFSIPVNNRDDVKLWHIRLGCMPFDSMKNISPSSSFSHFDHKCDICPVARQTKLPFPSSCIKTKVIFELIHVDTWGPYKSSTYNGYKYFLTIVDDFSRATWTYLLSTKSNAFPALKNYLAYIE
ncbi:uncharacterized protein LOC132613257 [Lycium barbarum]|uniref:uncharacterized protein LOC132613257 n=1 Tax=Lycium barbarum TaxID=112863 RepID=UPI00293E4B7B|nr:uncharacterized protein LOC132613257 [Lycium barbarum]